LVLEKTRKPKWVFKHADRLGAKYCAIIGTEEFENKEVQIKDLGSGEQEKVSMDGLSAWSEEAN